MRVKIKREGKLRVKQKGYSYYRCCFAYCHHYFIVFGRGGGKAGGLRDGCQVSRTVLRWEECRPTVILLPEEDLIQVETPGQAISGLRLGESSRRLV